MIGHELFDLVQFVCPEPMIRRQGNRVEPELGLVSARLHMDVGRLVAFVAEERRTETGRSSARSASCRPPGLSGRRSARSAGTMRPAWSFTSFCCRSHSVLVRFSCAPAAVHPWRGGRLCRTSHPRKPTPAITRNIANQFKVSEGRGFGPAGGSARGGNRSRGGIGLFRKGEM